MALISCAECGEKISDRASSCPRCGCPVAGNETAASPAVHRTDSYDPPPRSDDYDARRRSDDYDAPARRRPDDDYDDRPRRRPYDDYDDSPSRSLGPASRHGSMLVLLCTLLMPGAILAVIVGSIFMANAGRWISGYNTGAGYYGGYYYRDPAMENSGIACFLLAGAAFLTGLILAMVWLHQAWSVVPRDYDTPTPGQAVGLLFVPFFNLYWIFRAIPGLSLALDRQLNRRDRYRNDSPGSGYVVGIVACIFFLIPYVNLGIFPILFLVWLNIANGAKNRYLAMRMR
jgi:hypothetical protein